MATIDSKDLIIRLLESDGKYDGDPQVYKIYSYINDWDKETCAVFWHQIQDNIYSSPCCREVRLLWSRNGITPYGKAFIDFWKDAPELGLDDATNP